MPAIARQLPVAGSSVLNSAFSQIRRVFGAIVDRREQGRERSSLARLDDRLLADIGLTREQQAETCSPSFVALIMAGGCLPTRNRIVRSQNW
jgi:uncharacterized protein YjiS (DUF1127 family)